MLEGEDAGPLVRDMQERIAVHVRRLGVCPGRDRAARKSCALALASVVGEERGAHRCGLGRAVCREAGERFAPQAGEGKTDTRQNRLL